MANLNKIRVGGNDYDLKDASALHTSDVVQATGDSTTAVMSQKAVKDALANKADASTVTELSNTVADQGDTLLNKADSSDVTALSNTVATKADKSTVDSLSSTVTALSGDVGDLQEAIGTKAEASVVTELSNDVAAIETKITALEGTTHFIGAGALADRPGSADEGDIYVATDNGKEYIYVGDMWIELGDTTAEQQRLSDLEGDVDDLQEAIGTKADNSTVTALSNNVTTLSNTVSGLSGNVGDLQEAIGTKADNSTVTNLSNTVTNLSNSKADKTTVEALSGDVSDIHVILGEKADASTVTALSNTVNTKVSASVDGEILILSV